jgi:hypothetical protein
MGLSAATALRCARTEVNSPFVEGGIELERALDAADYFPWRALAGP